MNYAIEIKDLEKTYPDFHLENINISIPCGVIVGLIGENGAGKTTLIKSILNVIKTDSGSVKVFDKDYKEHDDEIKEDIGVILDSSFFPEILNPKNINSIMKDVYQNWDKKLFYQYLADFGIKDNQILKTMSKGMKKKVEIAAALAHHPKLLILDEPTEGLDPVARNELLDILLNFIQDEEHTVLLSTHITSDLEHIADHIIFLDNGRKIIDKSRDEIFDNYGILKCDIGAFTTIDKNDIVSYKKNRYDYEILVDDISHCKRKYKDYVIDKITLEDLMVIMIKGGR